MLASASHDCLHGCRKSYDPVCGSDGTSYQNGCVAECQGVSVASAGLCPGDDGLVGSRSALVTSFSRLRSRDMKKFSQEGFRFRGQVKRADVAEAERPQQQHASRQFVNNTDAHGAEPASTPREAGRSLVEQQPARVKIVRITRDGLLYESTFQGVATVTTTAAASASMEPSFGSFASFATDAADALAGDGAAFLRSRLQQQQASSLPGGRRGLRASFGADDRIDCPKYPLAYPYTAIGQIGVQDGSGNYICSGALIGPELVLTAAHCVYSRGRQAYYDKLEFAPARYRTAAGQVIEPYGKVPWDYVSFYSNYGAPGTADPNIWDIAVIKLASPIGNTAGWFGLRGRCRPGAPTPAPADSATAVLSTAGYPSDQPYGSCVFAQCTAAPPADCSEPYLYHRCDTAAGQSGSPMWVVEVTSSGGQLGPYIQGVHNVEWLTAPTPTSPSAPHINSAVHLTTQHLSTIQQWIASASTSPSVSTAAAADGSSVGRAQKSSTTPAGHSLL